MNVLDFSTSNSQITDEIINVANSNPINLKHDIFYNKTGKLVVIRTADGGGGTLLTITTDYTIGGVFPDGDLPASISPDVAYQTIAITNATYHNTNLYVSYYPIGDIINGTRFNAIQSNYEANDYDISSTNQTFDLTQIRSYPVGYVFRVSWHSGDGSNTFTFTGGGSSTINNIIYTSWVGQGTGYLDLRYLGSDKFEIINSGDIWDCDSGNFSTGSYNKFLNGALLITYSDTTSSGSSTTWNFPISTAINPLLSGNVLDNDAIIRSVMFTSVTTTSVSFACLDTAATKVIQLCSLIAHSRWTSLYPRTIGV